MALLDTLTYIGDMAQIAMIVGSVPEDGGGDIYIRYANPAAVALFGYDSLEEMICIDVRRLMPTSTAVKHQDHVNGYLNRDYVRKNSLIGSWRNLVGIRKDGSKAHVRANVCDCRSECGDRLFLAFFQDRTVEVEHEEDLYEALEEARALNENFQKFVKAIDDNNLVVHFTPEGIIKDVNQPYCALMGATAYDLIGQHHSIMVPEKARASKMYAYFWDQLRDGKPYRGTYERLALNGESVWIAGSYIPIKDAHGDVVEIIKVANDITEQIQDKIELQTKNTYLEHAAKILRHDMHSGINTYMPRGVKALERRLARTPETVEELSLDMPLKLIKDGLHHTQKVYAGVKEFTNLVKQGVELERQDLCLSELLEDYLRTTAYRSQVRIAELPVVSVNGPLFCTAIDNLIRNGLKYNDSPTKVVDVYLHKDGSLAIKDNGRGMSSRDFEEYSKPYVRKHGQVESGSGLGLNICIAILREHGFGVSCQKLKPCGTLIKVSFT